ncbi:MAG: hypothetical protein GOMPHAMPRED_006754 [Gomphillus americanus]|uniref:OPA3-like protein n=1 Tax=Gomphillus americanus TaxID=1940652 RepID=A0A8H3EPV4_9LECA|nr:MAG: hypothetical protein GOMPHAMPRED_006754 [Gomphillus americanus]
MSGVTLKIASLFIRTLAKPIANQIKVQAREHEGFKRICVNFAQSVHRVDMRLRLGLLQDHAAIERQIARDAKEAAVKKAQSQVPTVKTEAQTKADTEALGKNAEQIKQEKKAALPKIRPLGETKAIELGANFFSESFIFTVAVGLLLFERWYSSRKEKGRRNDLADNLAELEERDHLHAVELELLKQEVADLQNREKSYWGLWKRLAADDGSAATAESKTLDEGKASKPNALQKEKGTGV